MTATANFFTVPRTAVAQVTTANTARDGSGTPVTVMTAVALGTLIEDIEITATGTTTAGVVRLFIHDGTNARLWREYLVTAATPSTTVAVWSRRVTDIGLMLMNASWSLRATTHNTETFNVAVTRAADSAA